MVSNGIGESMLARMMRRVGFGSTLLGVLAMLGLTMGLGRIGCPPPPPDCTTNANCDDDDGCTSDVCNTTTGDCTNTPLCPDDRCVDDACVECVGDDDCDAGETCDDTNFCVGAGGECDGDEDCDAGEVCDNGSCVEETPECTGDGDCDNSDDCDGVETCVDGNCTDGTPVDCADGETCVDGVCVAECDSDDDCAAGDECVGPETCVDGACEPGAETDCDDGDPCTDDSCDGDTGCSSTPVDCPDGQTCNATTGDCEVPTDVPCTTDADCVDAEDGFCNGTQTCVIAVGETEGVCQNGDRPCDDATDAGVVGDCDAEGVTETCAEGDTAAVCTACAVETLDFTLAQDNLTGTADNDTFSAPLAFNPASGTQVATLQTGDVANGLAGTDVLNASLNAVATVVPTLSGIETINVTNFAGGTATLSGGNISGIDTLCSVSSVDDVIFSNLQEPTNFCLTTINSSAVDTSLQFGLAATTAGTTDAITGNLSGVNAGTVTIQTAAGTTNGFESLTVNSTGTSRNTLANITQTNGTTLTTMTLTGDQDLQLNVVPNTVTTVNGSALPASADLQLGSGTSAGAYVEFNTSNLASLTSGAGNDLVIFNNTLNSNDFTAGTADLGAGTDVVQVTFAADFLSASPFRNTEEVRVNATSASTVNFNGITGLVTITNEEDGAATALTLQNVPATSGAFPALQFRGDNGTGANQTFDTVTYNAVGNTGATDSLAVNVNNRGTALNTGTSTTFGLTVGGGATVANGFETLGITCADGPCTFLGVTDSTLVTLNVTGSSNVTLGTVDAVASTVLAVNASAVTGNFSATVDDIATGANITLGGGNDSFTVGAGSTGTSTFASLGAGNDTFVGDTNTASADTISAGEGSDNVSGGQGIDTVTTGGGADIVIYDQVAAIHAKNITDFSSGAGGDIMRFDISALALANAGAENSGAIAALANADDIFLLTGSGFATDAAAETAITADNDAAGTLVFIYFNTTDSSTHILYDTTAETDTTPAVLIGRLTNITTQAAHDAITTAANIDSQP